MKGSHLILASQGNREGGGFMDYTPINFNMSLINNNLDFKYAPLTDNGQGVVQVDFSIDVSPSVFIPGGHFIVVVDTQGGQGEGGNWPHCGPVIRNGQNLFAFARGFIVAPSDGNFPTGQNVWENWNGTDAPNMANPLPNGENLANPGVLHGFMRFPYGAGKAVCRIKRAKPPNGNLVAFTGNEISITTASPFYRASKPQGARAAMGIIGGSYYGPTPGSGCVEPVITGQNNIAVPCVIHRAGSYTPAPQTAKYWRIHGARAADWAVSEIEMAESPGGPNILTSSVACVSDTGAAQPSVVDGVTNTGYVGGFWGFSAIFTLPTPRKIRSIKLFNRMGPGINVCDLTVECSHDGIYYQLVKFISSGPRATGWDVINLD